MKVKCRRCVWYNYNFLSGLYEVNRSICGLHGSVEVNPDQKQPNLDGRGGCGFLSKNNPIQLTLKF